MEGWTGHRDWPQIARMISTKNPKYPLLQLGVVSSSVRQLSITTTHYDTMLVHHLPTAIGY